MDDDQYQRFTSKQTAPGVRIGRIIRVAPLKTYATCAHGLPAYLNAELANTGPGFVSFRINCGKGHYIAACDTNTDPQFEFDGPGAQAIWSWDDTEMHTAVRNTFLMLYYARMVVYLASITPALRAEIVAHWVLQGP